MFQLPSNIQQKSHSNIHLSKSTPSCARYNELAATSSDHQFDWVVTNQDIEAFLATAGENAQVESDDSFTVTSLTPSEQEELNQLTAAAEARNTKEPTLEELKEDPEFWEFLEQEKERRAKEKVANLPSSEEREDALQEQALSRGD